MKLRGNVVLLVGSVAACAGSSKPGAVATTACDPLAVATSTLSRGAFVGAGRDKEQRVYYVDRVNTAPRLFVAEGSTSLHRHNVSGVGEGADTLDLLTDDSTSRFALKLELREQRAVRMGLHRGALNDKKTFEIGVEGEELTMVSESELAGWSLSETSSVIVLYAATTNDGRRFVAFDRSTTTDAVRVFFGPPERMTQRRVLGESRDSTVHLTIDLDGVETNVQLNFPISGAMFGASRLDPRGQAAIPLTPMPGSPGEERSGAFGDAGAVASPRAEPETFVRGATFYCF